METKTVHGENWETSPLVQLSPQKVQEMITVGNSGTESEGGKDSAKGGLGES